MGCVSSKHIKKDLKKETILNGGGSSYTNHVVSLTSSTYGALKLDKDAAAAAVVVIQPTPPVTVQNSENSPARKSTQGPPEVINAWELMEDLEDEPKGPESGPGKKSPKLRRGETTPMKVVVNPIGSSPKVSKRFSGKENKKASTLPPNLRISKKGGCESPVDSGLNSARRKNLGLLFDPDRVDPNAKKKVQENKENKENKKVGLGGLGTPTSQKVRNSVESTPMLTVFEKKSPPGGQSAVVIYTTTLRGIRKTFEECNIVRGIIESHQVRIIERDVSMDSGFKEELRALLGKKEVRVPVVLIKGRLIGGSEEIMKLEEEGKLGILLDGIPTKAAAGCKGCCGVRFVMCTVCNGSCKLIGGDGRRSVKCLECNENGLVQCPFCC